MSRLNVVTAGHQRCSFLEEEPDSPKKHSQGRTGTKEHVTGLVKQVHCQMWAVSEGKIQPTALNPERQ